MALPQYVFDPVTQSYKLVQQPAGQMPPKNRGLYDLVPDIGGGDAFAPPVGPGLSMTDPGMAEMGVGMQNAALGLMDYGSMPFAPGAMLANVAGNVLMGITTSPSMMGMATPSPVAPPAMPVESPIAPSQTANLQGMNNNNDNEDDAPEGIVSIGALSTVSPEAVAEAAAVAAQAQADAQAAATAASDSGPATATGAGEASDASVSGANSEASHDADGNNSGGGGSSSSGCFLTTAATKYMGQPDNGPVLSTLRNFRDTYMRKDKEKSKDVNWYYTNAPRIMRELDKREDAPEVYREMYKEYIYPAYQAIKKGNKVEAYTTYKALVNFAKRKSGIDNDELTPKPKHMANGGIASIAREGMNYQGGGYATPRPYIYNQPTMMAEGGLAAAKQTQDAGRGQDTMLVHMTPKEVAGLQSLAMAHGGSLTINPKTGLPEAGFLSAILPTALGFALAPVTGGASAALLVGAGYTAATGSLKKGLMAGLGAFGGANIASGLGAAGGIEGVAPEVVSTATPATSAATQITPEMLNSMPPVDLSEPLGGAVGNMVPTTTTAGDLSLAQLPPVEYPNVAMPTPGESMIRLPNGDMTYVSQYGGPSLTPQGQFAGTGGIPAPDVVQAPPPVSDVYPDETMRGTAAGIKAPPTPGRPTYAQMGRGFENVFDQGQVGEQARKAFFDKAGYGSLASAAAPVLTQEPEPLQKRKSYIRPYDVNVTNRSSEMAGLYGPGSTSGREMLSYEFTPRPIYEAAGGGLMDLKAGGTFDDEYGRDEFAAGGLTAFAEGKQVKKSKKLSGDPYYKFADSRKDTSMEAALDANFAKGGGPRYLNGKGDGMSDDIPAIIDGKQPARLADGEFVIPADVVSHLGNGSSKAGAKKLYSMMDRIRKARTGKKSQAPAVKSERYMPA